ncbi:MAG: hypothetical protein ACOYEW_09235 [Anaerolineae bacterium]
MPADDRRHMLKESVRQIVVTRERTPRSPLWAAAWRRTLFRYVGALRDPEADEDGRRPERRRDGD